MSLSLSCPSLPPSPPLILYSHRLIFALNVARTQVPAHRCGKCIILYADQRRASMCCAAWRMHSANRVVVRQPRGLCAIKRCVTDGFCSSLPSTAIESAQRSTRVCTRAGKPLTRTLPCLIISAASLRLQSPQLAIALAKTTSLLSQSSAPELLQIRFARFAKVKATDL